MIVCTKKKTKKKTEGTSSCWKRETEPPWLISNIYLGELPRPPRVRRNKESWMLKMRWDHIRLWKLQKQRKERRTKSSNSKLQEVFVLQHLHWFACIAQNGGWFSLTDVKVNDLDLLWSRPGTTRSQHNEPQEDWSVEFELIDFFYFNSSGNCMIT